MVSFIAVIRLFIDQPKRAKKKWTFERKKHNPKERNLKNQMDI
jgi:hypothetical protein